MRLRTPAAVLAIALTAAACAGGGDTGLADGSQTVEEATSDASGSAASAGTATSGIAEEGADEAAGGDADGTTGATDGNGTASVEALWWTADTVADGSSFVAADLAGEDVVLWMWAPWCTVCNGEAPEVADAIADLPEGVTLVGVAGRDEVGPMRDFVAEHGLDDITHVVDADGSVWASYGVSYQPAWVFIDGEGNTSVAAGALGYEGLFEGIDEVFGS